MSSERSIKHPLRRANFYWECFVYATGGALGRSGDASLIASLALPAWKAIFPSSYAIFASWLSSYHLSADILLWKLPLWVGGSILALRLIAAPFFLYRDKPSADSTQSAHGSESRRNKTSRLAAEIAQFVAMRRENKPHRRIIDLLNDMPAELRYAGETAALYAERFLKRVNDIREELTLAGVVDAKLDGANANPALAENMQIISDRLKEIANQLPDSTVSDVASLHQANTRLQIRIDELENAARGRHLTNEDKSEIIRIAGTFLTETLKRWNDPRYERIEIVVIAIGGETETQDFRDDFVDAFNAAGFDGLPHTWPAGIREHQHFRNAVTLINSTPPGNIWHKPLLSALRAARVSTNTADQPWLPDPRFRMEPPLADRPVAYLIVGQRG